MLTTAQMEQEEIQNTLNISDSDNDEFTSDSDDSSYNLSDQDYSI